MRSTTGTIAQYLGAQLVGPLDIEIQGFETLDRAAPGHLTFIRSASYAHQWPASKASAAIVTSGIAADPGPGRAFIVVPNADLALAKLLEFVAPKPAYTPGVHPTAAVDPSATLGQGVSIGPNCTIGPRTTVGDGAVLIANVALGADVAIGRGTILHPGVVVGDRCRVGQACIFYGGVIIGADGFGYLPAPNGRGIVKIPHVGNVEIGDAVEIGANSCIDRAKFGSTVIGSATKIDNLCQIGHNCRIGRACLICGLAGIGGSVTIGDGVVIAGHVGIADNLKIGDRAVIAAKSGVMNDIPAGETWWGFPAQPAKRMARSMAVLRNLPELARAVRALCDKAGVPYPGRESHHEA